MANNNRYNNRGQRGQNRAATSFDESSGGKVTRKIVLAIFALVIAAYVIISLVFGMWNPLKWNEARLANKTGNAQTGGDNADAPDDTGDTANSGTSESADNFLLNESENSNDVQLFSARLPRAAYAVSGVSAQAESVYSLTATLEPADLEDKTVNWSVAWKNASSTWASGKTVTDYVRVVPTSDGALTANAECLQAFAEQVIITVAPRIGGEYVNAKCTADYRQKVLGLSFEGKAMSKKTGGTMLYGFNLDPSNLNPVIDFPTEVSPEAWGYYYADYGVLTRNYVTSGTYTKAVSEDFAHYVNWTVSATSDYLNALKAGGLTPYSSVSSSQYVSNNNALGGFFFKNWVNGVCSSASNWSAFKTSLRNNSDKVMLRIKCEWGTGDMKGTCTYNVKFSAESLKALATNATLDPSIEF